MAETASVLGVAHQLPDFSVPAGAADCHVHVFGPAARFPFWAKRSYTPADAGVEDLTALHRALRIERVVIVHPSPYGTDNACTVDALRRLGPARARGVAVIDAGTTDEALAEMHEAGMRGVRVNLETAGVRDPKAAEQQLAWAAARVARLGWHVQTYADLSVLTALEPAIERLPVTLAVDHFGRAKGALGPAQPGFATLTRLLRQGKIYVKLSAAYRLSTAPDYADMGPLARALADANPERVLWGSDWPHPGMSTRGARPVGEIEPFHPEDDGAALNRLHRWLGADAGQTRLALVENPARLYGF